MSLAPFLRAWFGDSHHRPKRRPFLKRARLGVEILEERTLLSGAGPIGNPPPIVNANPPANSGQPGSTIPSPTNPSGPGANPGSAGPPQVSTPATNAPQSNGTGPGGQPGSSPGATGSGSLPDTNSRFIEKLYEDLLHRSAGADEIAGWTNAMLAGVAPQTVALEFTASLEYRSDLIREDYRTILGRDPGAAEIDGWLGPMQIGLTEKRLAASFLASGEFYVQQGGTDSAWLTGMYRMVLRRAPDAAGVSGWTGALNAGMSRMQVALGFLDSFEANIIMVANAYSAYLQRQGGPGELLGWAFSVPPTTNANQVMSMIVSAPEYLAVPDNFGELASSFESISGVTPDSGISGSDGITNAPMLTLKGNGTANASFVIAVDGVVNGWGRSGRDGTWTTSLSAPLAEGTHTIAVRVDSGTGTYSNPAGYTTVIEQTPPSVNLQPSSTTGLSPALTVTATDDLPFSAQATIDVDLKRDGTFSDPGDMNFAVGALVNGVATIPLTGLTDGDYLVRARVSDLAGNEGTSQTMSVQVVMGGSNGPFRYKKLPTTQDLPTPAGPGLGFIGSQALTDLFNAYSHVAGLGVMLTPGGGAAFPTGASTSPNAAGSTSPANAGPNSPGDNGPALPSGGGTSTPGSPSMTVPDFIKIQSQYYVFDPNNDILVRVRLQSRDHMEQAASDLKNNLGMTITQALPQQFTLEGYLPIASLPQLVSVTDFGAVTPAYAAILNSSPVTSQGDAAILADQFRASTGFTGAGVTIGAISDSVSKVAGGIAGSVQIGALPASGVNVLQDGTSSANTDEGRGLLEVAHDVAPGASLAFSSADQGPQAMAQGIVNLATQAGAKVIVDDVTFPDEPFFNDGLVAQAVNQVVKQNDVLYVTSAGNLGNNAWTDKFRPVSAVVGGMSGSFENFDSGSGQNLLQQFTLQPGQTLDLAFQWDAPFLEGGSPLPQYQVPNSLAARVLDGAGLKVLKSFADVNQNTGEALQRVIFTNDGSYGTTTFALAFQLVSGPAPTMLKWVRFDQNAPAQYQGAPAIFGHAAAAGALTVGAVPYNNVQGPEPFTSQGTVAILFDANGNRLAKPEVRNKPDVAGPDGVSTADFPVLPGLPAGAFPVFTGTSAAAAHVAGAAALLRQKLAASTAPAIDTAIIGSALDIGPAGWDPRTGAGLVQLPRTITATARPASYFNVGPVVDISHSIKPNAPSTGSSGSGTVGAGSGSSDGSSGSNILLNAFPNVDTTAHVNNEWEEDIAINPTNPQQLFLGANEDTSTPGVFVSVSKDGGVTWAGRIIGDGNDSFTTSIGDPSVSWDSFGNLFFSYLDFNGGNPDKAVLLLSTDGGVTFKQIATFAAKDQPKVATGAGSVWMVMNNSDLEAAGAKVTGLGAVGAFIKAESVPNSSGGNFGTISIGPTGQVIVSYQSAGSGAGPDTIFTALDPDGLGAAGFNNAIAATPTNVGSFRPITPQPSRTIDADGRVAYDRSPGPHNGRVYLDYVDAADTSTSNTNIFVRFSDDNGSTWSAPVRVNDDSGNASHFWPRLMVDQTSGAIAMSWYDTRNDTGPGSPGDTDGTANDSTEFFATASADGGATFLPNVQVAQGPSNAIANPNNGNEYGDYSGLAFFGGNFYPSWADNSNSTGNNPDGALKGFDVYTAKLSFANVLGASGQDTDETNQTSDMATNLGVLGSTASVNGFGIAPLFTGLPDYDWVRWAAAQPGTFTATIHITPLSGDLELHIFTVNSQNTLIDLGDAVAPGATTLTLSTNLAADEPILVEVKGRESSPGVFGKGIYDLSVTLQ